MNMFSERILKDNMNVKKCDLCGNVQMAVSIKIEDSEKTVCCKCTEALFFKMMYLVGAIPFESVEQLKEVTAFIDGFKASGDFATITVREIHREITA